MTWKDAALAHAKEQDPKESCGLLIEIKGKDATNNLNEGQAYR